MLNTDYGLLIGAQRDAEADSYYWRMTQFLMPSYTMIPGGRSAGLFLSPPRFRWTTIA